MISLLKKFYKGDRKAIVVLVFLVIIASFGFELRYESVSQSIVDRPIRADAVDYYSSAYNLRHLGTYSRDSDAWRKGAEVVEPDAFRSPGYPLFIAPFIDGPPTKEIVDSILFAQVIISTITVMFAFSLFRASFSSTISLIAALLVAISPHLVTANIYLLTETLSCFFLVISFWSFSKYLKTKHLRFLFFFGAFIACSALVRPSAQYFIVPLLLFIFALDWKGNWKKTVSITLLGFVIVMSPWTLRNMTIEATEVSLARETLAIGMYPGLMYKDDPRTKGMAYRANPDHYEIQGDGDLLAEEFLRRFTEEPRRHIQWFLIGKPVLLWSWDIVGGVGDVWVYPVKKTPYAEVTYFKASRELMKLFHETLMALGLIGIVLVWLPFMAKRYSTRAIVLLRCISLFLLYHTLLHMIGAPYPRYSIPTRPLMYGMSMVPIVLAYSCIFRWVGEGGQSINKN